MERTVLVSLDKFNEAKEFWLGQLDGQLPKVELPADVPGARRFEEAELPVTFPPGAGDRLRQMSKGNPLSLYILLLTALDIVLYKYTMQREVLAASPIYQANPQEFNEWVAFCTTVEGDTTFKELLMAVKQTVVEGYKHQYYPFPKLVEALGLENESRLTRVLVSMTGVHDPLVSGKVARQLEPDLYLALESDAGAIGGKLHYNGEKFSSETMDGFWQRLLLVVEQVAEDTSIRVKDIQLLTAAQKQDLLKHLSGRRHDYQTQVTIPQLFGRQAEQTPEQTALRAARDLSDVFEGLTGAADRDISWDTLKNCCFLMNPYLLSSDVKFHDDDTGYKILKTRQHNSVVVDDNLYALLELFDGQRTGLEIFDSLQGQEPPLLLYSVNADDVMEIGNRFGKKEIFHLDDSHATFTFILKRLFQEKLVELVDVREEAEPGKERVDSGYFPLQAAHPHREELDIILSRDKIPQQADVLIFGDTPGLSSTGLLYLASYLTRNGFKAYCQFSDTNWERESQRENIKELLAQVRPKVVAVSMKWFLHIARTLETCRLVKEFSPDTKVVLGGNSASYYWKEVIQYDFIDVVVRGDGELPLLEICRGAEDIPNCAYKRDGEVIESPMTYIHDEVNSKEIYLSNIDDIMLSTYAPFFGIFFVYTQRGCLLNCIYCGGCNQAMRKTFNRKNLFVRDPEEVRKDITAIIPYTSTLKFLFDDFDNQRLLEYCKAIWDGIDLSSHFLFITNVVPPTDELVEYVNRTFKYVYWNVDLCSLSERHRKQLQKLGLAKPQPTDAELLGFLDKCERYENNELIINLIVGLPYFNYDDIDESKRMMDHIMNNYASFSELFWARLHAQPGAPIVDNAGDYGMYTLATTFEEFLEISRRNFEDNAVYPGVDNFYYPYIYFKDDRLNSKLSQYYSETNNKIIQFRNDKRRKLMVYKDWTYAELGRQVDAVAAKLDSAAIPPQSIIGVVADRSLEMVAAMLGIMRAGCAYLPIDPTYPAARVSYMLKDSGARSALVQSHLLDRVQFDGEIIGLCGDPADGDAPAFEDRSACGAPAYVIYTSGSTGLPKGVLVEHQSIVNTLQWRKEHYCFDHNDTVLQIPSFSFDSSVEDIFTPLISGSRLLLIQEQSRFNLPYLSDLIRKNRVSHFLIVPNFYRTFLQEIPDSLKGLRTVTVAGENFTPDLVALHHKHCPDTGMFNEYGPTENSVCSTVYKFAPDDRSIWIGIPIDNVDCYMLDRDLGLTPIGVPGEMCVAGAGLARGYLNRVELTHEKFVADTVQENGNMYRTGDRGRVLSNGQIEFLGRVDQQVKIRGFRIEAGEIENRILQKQGVKEAVVDVGKKIVADGREENFLCAYLVASGQLDIKQLREELAEELPEYMVPAYFIPLEKIPLTPNGKIDRKALPSPDDMSDAGSFKAPQTPMEKKLAELWSEILSREVNTIGVEDTFFELGGHSLNATIAVSRLHKEFHVRIPLAEFFSISTIKALAEHIRHMTQERFETIEPAAKQEVYPLSAAQKRLYVLHQLEEDNIGYNMPMAIQLKGTLSSRLEEVFHTLVARHESLRTSFELKDSQPVQRIHQAASLAIERIQLENTAALAQTVEDFVRPFDLTRAPLMRVGLVELEPEHHILLVDIHHIVSDGVSQLVLQDEFTALYSGQQLPLLTLHYKDYSQWQHSEGQQEAHRRQEQYWVERFAGELPVLQLPTDYQRPAVQTFEGASYPFTLEASIVKPLKEVAAQHDATLFMAVLALFMTWLAKLSGQEDIIIGTPVSGRRHADLERVIGMFVNTLALRGHVEPRRSFKELLAAVRDDTLEAFENQDFQFEDLVENPDLDIRRDLSRNPLFDVMFVFQNMESQPVELDGLTIEPYEYENAVSKFDLTLQAYEEDDVLHLSLEYCTRLFKAGTVERLAGYLEELAGQLTTGPSVPLREITILPDLQKQRILKEFNDTKQEFPLDITVPQLLEREADKQPDKTAVVWDSGSMSYGELNRRARRFAAGLLQRGAGPGSIVPILHRRSPDLVVAMYGILRAGAGYLTIDWEAPLERIEFILADSGSRLLVQDPAFDRPYSFEGTVVTPEELESAGDRKGTLPDYPPHDNPFYILYTSGSTGIPKGVMVEYRSVMNMLYSMARRCPMREDGVYLFKTNYTFDVSVAELFGWLMGSGALAVLRWGDEKDSLAVADAIQTFAVTHVSFVPSMLLVFLEAVPAAELKKIEGLRYMMVGGEAVTTALAEKITAIGLDAGIENLYGPTETTVYTTKFTIRPGGWERSVSIGTPIDNVHILVMDPANPHNIQPVGIAGEIYISGPGVSRGYLNRPEMTAARYGETAYFNGERCYRSGDLGRFLPDGNLEYLGRIDQQVKVRGFRIELGEIENKLLEHEDVDKAAAVIKYDPSGEAYLAAYVVAETGSPLQGNAVAMLKEFLSKKIPGYMVPSFIVELETMPLNRNGKVDRRALPDPAPVDAETYVPPQGELEEALAAIWARILFLEPEQISAAAGFFDLGGNSLKATMMLARVHRQLGVNIPLFKVFDAPTIQGLALLVEARTAAAYSAVTRAEERDAYPLSPAQQRMYFLQQLDLNSTVYNLPSVVELEREPDPETLELALSALIRRHESLRTRFGSQNGRPFQQVVPDVDFLVEYVDEIEAADEPSAIIRRFVRPFDLSQAPLLRVGVLKLRDGRHLLLSDMHHIISDGVSINILVRDFLALMDGQELPPLDLHYKDYAVWWRRQEQEGRIEKQKQYWLERFSGELPALNLPLDYPRPAVRSFEGDIAAFTLEAPLVAKLEALASSHNATLYMVLMTLFYTWLAKLTAQQDFIVGTPVAGRRQAELEDMIGMFVNTLAVRGRVEPDTPFDRLLDETRERMLQAFENQDVPFEDLVEQVVDQRDPARNPLFDVVFVFQNMGDSELSANEREFSVQHPVARFDLTLSATPHDGGIGLTLEYCTRLFSRQSIDRFCRFYQLIARQAANSPSTSIRDISILTDREKERVLNGFNDTASTYPSDMTVWQLFERQVEETPDSIALMDGNQTLTYRQLDTMAGRAASYLVRQGLTAGEPVAIMMPRSLEMLIGVLAILKAGGAYVPVNLDYPVQRKRLILDDCGARWLLVNGPVDGDFDCSITAIGDMVDHEEPIALDSRTADPNHLCYIMYTSGTTGTPKGVMVEHRNVTRLVKHTEFIDFSSVRRILQTGALEFDASTFEIWGAFLNGLTLALAPTETIIDAQSLKQALSGFDIDTVWLTAPLFNRLLDADITLFETLRFLLVGGDALSPLHINRLRQHYPHVTIINGYGPTENTTFSTTFTVRSEFKDNIPIGAPITNSTAYIVDCFDRLQPVGIPGEILVGGDGVARGYLGDPEKTAEKFMEDPFKPGGRLYRTGDLGRWRSDGAIEFLGRIDNQVKIRGFRVELGEIENRLKRYPHVLDAVVAVREDNHRMKYLAAYMIPAAGKTLDSKILRDYLAEYLPSHMIPSYLIPLDAIPLNPNGKVDHIRLPEPTGATTSAHQPPSTDTERRLAAIWSDVLGTEPSAVSVNADFFQSGGHSLRATVLTAAIHREFDVRIPLVEIFKTPTIGGLAQYIDSAALQAFLAIDPVEKRDYYPLSPAQKRMVILQQMDPDNTVYNIPMVFPIDATIGFERLERVLRQMVRRHEALRTSFVYHNDVPVQRIHDDVPFSLQRHVVETEEQRDAELRQFVRPFDLAAAPLIRVALVEMPDQSPYLMMDVHHAVSDGVSMNILANDFQRLLDEETLPPLPIQYKDYSQWRNRREETGVAAQELEYWTSRLGDGIPALDLPIDFPRPPVQDFSGGLFNFQLRPEETESLKQLASTHHTTLYMTLLAVFYIWLAKISGNEDIVVGTPVAGRGHADLEQIVGMFVNTLALRNNVDLTQDFDRFLTMLAETTIQAFQYQDVPFEAVVEALDIPRDPARNPLFDVMFVFQNQAEARETTTGERPELQNPVSRFDLTMSAMETGDSLGFTVEYSSGLYRRETVERLVAMFQALVRQVVREPRLPMNGFQLMDEAEKQTILTTFNNTRADYPRQKMVHELFEEQAEQIPENTALIYDEGTMTYAELSQAGDRLAAELQRLGAAAEETVAIMLPRSPQMIAGLLGILKAGCAYVPINMDYPLERKQYLLADCRARWIVTDGEGVEGSVCEVIGTDFMTTGHGPVTEVVPVEGNPHGLCYIIYTSGSTGRPKGVMVEHLNVTRLVQGTNYIDFATAGRILQTGALEFDASTFEIWGALLNGLELVLISTETIIQADALRDLIQREQVDTMWLTAPLLNQLVDADIGIFTGVGRILTGGDVLSPPHIERLRNLYPQMEIINCYGPTENTTFSTTFPITDTIDPNIPIGYPIANSTVYIVDRFNQLQPIGIAGEILVGGDGVARGYLGDPEKTVAAFIDDPFNSGGRLYRTGDLGRWLENGAVQFLGRIDQQVKIRGFRVELGEIETLLRQDQWVRDAVVIAADDSSGAKYLAAYVVAGDAGDDALDINDIRRNLAQQLPGHMIPSQFIQLDAIPLTINGKVDRRALPKPEVAATQDYVAPETPTEKKMQAIWAGILSLPEDSIGVTSNFFELGGHSLRATILTARIHKEFEVRVPLIQVFTSPFIRELSLFVDQAAKQAFKWVDAVEKRDYYLLSAAQQRLFILQQMEPQSTAYNIPQIFPLDADIDLERLALVFNRLANRHEVFKTYFASVEEETVQRVLDRVEIDVEYVDSGLSPQDVVRKFVRPFDLSRAPLLRVGVLKREADVLLLVDIHHIISDGTSVDILINEFLADYEGRELTPLRIQYKDYAHWQHSDEVKQRIEEEEKYWLDVFSGQIPALNLPTDFPRPNVQTYSGRMYEFPIGRRETAAINNLAQQTGTTLFMVLLAIFNTWLAKLSGQEDIVVGTPVAGRGHADLAPIIGMFVNTLALRNVTDMNATFNESLRQVKDNTLEAFENQEFQFEELVEKVLKSRDISRNPLFDVMFELGNMGEELTYGDETPGMGEEVPEYENVTSKFDMTMAVTRVVGRLQVVLTYNVQLFKEDTIRRLSEYFVKLVQQVIEAPDVRLGDLQMTEGLFDGKLDVPQFEVDF
jgi:tyrocidine synthetase-3